MSSEKTENPKDVPEALPQAAEPSAPRKRRTSAKAKSASEGQAGVKAPAKPRAKRTVKSAAKGTTADSKEAAAAAPAAKSTRKRTVRKTAEGETAPVKRTRRKTTKKATPEATPSPALVGQELKSAALEGIVQTQSAASEPVALPAATVAGQPQESLPEQPDVSVKEEPAQDPVSAQASAPEPAVSVAVSEITAPAEPVPLAVEPSAPLESRPQQGVAPVKDESAPVQVPAQAVAPEPKGEIVSEPLAQTGPKATSEPAAAAVSESAAPVETSAPAMPEAPTTPSDVVEQMTEPTVPAFAVAAEVTNAEPKSQAPASDSVPMAGLEPTPVGTPENPIEEENRPVTTAARQAQMAKPQESKPAPTETAAAGSVAASPAAAPVAAGEPSLRSEALEKPEPRADESLLPQICRSWSARIALIVVILALCCTLPSWWYFERDVAFPDNVETVDVTIPAGSSGREIARRVADSGIGVSADTFQGVLRVQGASLAIHAGRYRFERGMALADIVDKLHRGEVEKFTFRIADGQPIWVVREAVGKLPDITVKTTAMSEEELRAAVGVKEPSLEGVFAPETYSFRTGITDVDVLRAAYREQMRILDSVWEARSPEAVVKSKYEALILASIIEKETSLHTDRSLVSSVFNNRLRLRMPLQTDPTIIYGIGRDFDGNLTRRDMQRPGPYNTYLNSGLPPTPISMPTAASIHAALNPQKTKYLYFVARGDGTTYFSSTLAEHNRAVEKYQKAPARKAQLERKRQNNAR